MEFDRVQKNSMWESDPPIFGAIFMANRSTKKECLCRKLFGLPPPQINFVKKVKCGMLLFLFEFEERKLFGVFQAISDGALDIVPHAYNGKFPAQIRVMPIWDCKPLYECDFRDAILDNYYTSNKFNFGLSKHQVIKLLWLFDSRKMKVQNFKSPVVREKLLREECLDMFALREKSIDRFASPDHYRIGSENTPSDRDRSRHAMGNNPVNMDMDCYPAFSASNISSFADKHTVETKGFMIGDNGLSSLGQLRSPEFSPYSKSSAAPFPSSEHELVPFCFKAEKANPPPMKPMSDVNLDYTTSFGDFIPLDDEYDFEPAGALPPQSLFSRDEHMGTTNVGVYGDLSPTELSLNTLFSSKPATFGMENLSTPLSPSKHPPYVPSCQYPAKLEVDGSPFLNIQNAKHIGLQSDVGNERVSVFSRLKDCKTISLKDDVFSRLKDCEKISLKNDDNRADVDFTDLSVDELMDRLSQYQREWVTSTENSEHKVELSEVDDCANSDIAHIECEDAEEQQYVEEIKVNFKRRNRGRFQNECHVEESDGLSNTVPRKRRKLLRPSFVGEETEDKGVTHDSCSSPTGCQDTDTKTEEGMKEETATEAPL